MSLELFYLILFGRVLKGLILILLECLVEVTDDAVWSWRGFVERLLITDPVSLFDDCLFRLSISLFNFGMFPICFKVLTAGSTISAFRPLVLQSVFNSWGYLLKQVRKLFQESSSSCQLSRLA